ncbi:MAG: peroxiredoxin [Candidatus Paceibacteria bacterium]|jgi:peroxiredoxin
MTTTLWPKRSRTSLYSSLFLVSALLCPGAYGNDLAIGDPAPDIEVSHWLKGDAVPSFAAGQIYVLEFWATWCGPCVGNMEHLSKIQEAYADRGVTVIGLSDEALQTTVKFLLKPAGAAPRMQNDRARYTLATDPDRSVHQAYFEAAGLRGIPAAFVIGKDARIEWFGHPVDLDPVLAAVEAGTWDRDQYLRRNQEQFASDRVLRNIERGMNKALREHNWKLALEFMDQLIVSGEDIFVATKYGILMSRMKEYKRGYAYANQMLAQAWNSNAWVCFQLGWITLGTSKFPFDESHRDLDFALKAAKRATQLESSSDYFSILARIHIQREEPVLAVEPQRSAIAILEKERPLVLPHQLEGFEAQLLKLKATLATYEEQAKSAGVE